MKPKAMVRCWLYGLAVMLAVANFSVGAAPERSALDAAQEAVKNAAAEEETTKTEWNSREMARSATREIARSERKRAEDALQNVLAAQDELQQNVAAAEAARLAVDAEQDHDKTGTLLQAATKASVGVAAARRRLRQSVATMRTVGQRLVDDSHAAAKAAQELIVVENALRDKMAATRAAETHRAGIEGPGGQHPGRSAGRS